MYSGNDKVGRMKSPQQVIGTSRRTDILTKNKELPGPGNYNNSSDTFGKTGGFTIGSR